MRAPDERFVFVHINKTGGSSIEAALGLAFRHRSALELVAELGRAAWDDLFSFSIVRNPWDKVASHYSYRVQTNQTGMGDRPIAFNDWVREAYGRQNPAYYDKPKMFMPQRSWLVDDRGELLVDYVGRFEDLQGHFDEICRRIGRPPTALPRLKRSERASYPAMYDRGAREIVERWFAADIDAFGYRFE